MQRCVVRLRKVIGAATTEETHPAGYRLVLGDDDLDVRRVERLLGRARERLALRAPTGRYGSGGFDGRIGIVDVETGEVDGPADPVHRAGVAARVLA